MNLLIRKLYTEEELQGKIQKCKEEHEHSEAKKYYQGMISATYAMALIYEILEEEEKSKHFLEKVVDEWNTYQDNCSEYKYLIALMKLGRQEEALEGIVKNPEHWGIKTLAHACQEVGRKNEAILLYSGLAVHAREISEIHSSPWRSHYLQKASDLWEKAENQQLMHLYNQRALEAWEKEKDSIDEDLYTIEKAWLYEEVGYIHEKALKFQPALDYYQKAKAEYEKSYTEEVGSAETNYFDGEGDHYLGFFSLQIRDWPYIDLPLDSFEENDLRRIKYRILNIEEKMRA
jgi:tetratricopeptide (TPR) repeat protein